MKEIIAFCGNRCHECGAYIATMNDDDEKRREVAALWSRQYNVSLKPEDIRCTGCLTVGDNVFNYCKICEIRRCAMERGVISCAHCDEYACERLAAFFKMNPPARATLEEIRRKL